MCRNTLRLLAIAFALVALVAIAQPAEACTLQCQIVAPFCKACVDTGSYTGAVCQQVGSCGCRYVQVVCLASASEAAELPGFLEAEPVLTPAQPVLAGEQPLTPFDPETAVAAD
jgi:hypothetical protein